MSRVGEETAQLIPGKYSVSVGRTDMPTPEGWAWTRLLDIARLESGHTPSRLHPEYWGGDVPWVGIKDARVHHGGVICDTFQKVTEEGLANSAARWLPTNTVCLSRTASVGYVTVLGRPMATSQDFVNWICSDALEPKFLMQALLAEGDGLLRFGMGTTHTTIYFPQVMAFHVCIPPVQQQRRIVTKLEVLNAESRRAKEALDAIPPLLEHFRQSVLASAFRGDLTAAWRAKNPDVEPADKLLARIRIERRRRWEEAELARMQAKGKTPGDDRWKEKYEEPEPVDMDGLPELPEGWCWAGLSEIAEIQLGQRRAPEYEKEASFPYVRAANITWRGLDLSDVKSMGFANPKSLFLKRGDVVLNEASGSSSEVGKAAIWQDEIRECCFQATVLRVRSVSSELGGNWLRLVFLRDALVGKFAAMAPGMGIVHLTAERMRNWPIPMAPATEQLRLVQMVESSLEQSYRVADSINDLRARAIGIDASILAKAFRGELVPQDPSDEPASVLLERIRKEREAAGPTGGRGRKKAAPEKAPAKEKRAGAGSPR